MLPDCCNCYASSNPSTITSGNIEPSWVERTRLSLALSLEVVSKSRPMFLGSSRPETRWSSKSIRPVYSLNTPWLGCSTCHISNPCSMRSDLNCVGQIDTTNWKEASRFNTEILWWESLWPVIPIGRVIAKRIWTRIKDEHGIRACANAVILLKGWWQAYDV
jgi:hypothetical protein